MKKLIITVTVLLLLVVSLAVVGYKESNRRIVPVTPEPKEEEPQEVVKNIIVKEEIKCDKEEENTIKRVNTRYVSDVSKYIKDLKIINSNYDEYEKGNLRIEDSNIIYDYDGEDENKLDDNVEVTRYIMDYFKDVKTIIWNQKPNSNNEVILYVVNSYTMAEYPNTGDGLHRIVINVKDKTIKKYTFDKLSFRDMSIASITCLGDNCNEEDFYIIACSGTSLTTHAYTDYKFNDEDTYSLVASSNLESDLKTQEVVTNINGKEHTIKMELKKQLNREVTNRKGEKVNSNIIEYRLYIDNKEINGAYGYYLTDEYLTDHTIKLEDSNIKITKGIDNKEYAAIKVHLPNDSSGSDEISIINDSGDLLATLKYDLSVNIGSLKGKDSNSYKTDNANALVAKNSGRYSLYTITNQFIKFIRPIEEGSKYSEYEEKAIVIQNNKASLKSTSEKYEPGTYSGEDTAPTINVKIY